MLGLGVAKKIGLGNVAAWFIKLKQDCRIKKKLKTDAQLVKARNRQKIFVIGFHKTGTTSIGLTFEKLGYMVANQRQGELLFNDWLNQNHKPIINFCKTAEVFQDTPFSLPNTYKFLAEAFPDSKFILTLRDNPEQWYQSLTTFHGKMWGNGNVPPTADDLKNANYLGKGRPLYNLINLYKTTTNNPYDKDKLIAAYTKHHEDVINYFTKTPEKLLVINVSQPSDFERLIAFLGIKSTLNKFPHISSSNISNKDYACDFLKPL